MARDLLMEIGLEEVPPSYLVPAAHGMRDLLLGLLDRSRVGYGKSKVYFTPRRLALHLEEVADHQERAVLEILGPPAAVAFDTEGKPTRAATGFARAQGVPVAQLRVKETEKGEVVCCQRVDEGVETQVLLKDLLPRAIREIEFPKSMRWEETGLRFARPIRWIVALFGRDVVPFEMAGVRAGRETEPHRFGQGRLSIEQPSRYEKVLEDGKVIVDAERRRKLVSDGIEREARKAGGRVVEDAPLLSEVTHMVEYPVAVMGGFDSVYLDLPSKVLITALREHQRYFAVEDSRGRILPHFIGVADSPGGDEEVIRTGNERILTSRLEDAKFYWDEDRKQEFSELVDRLKGVVWQEDLGSLYDKTGRIVDLTQSLCHQLKEGDLRVAERAAYLSKADLVTSMVRDGKEFTTLQGVMGREYALASGEDPRVAEAIYEHYLPRFPGDQLPKSAEGAMVSVGDKVDTICGLFAAGKIPSGSQDPLGLRRQANSVIAILVDRCWHISLGALVDRSVNLLSAVRDLPAKEELKETIVRFFTSRVAKYLEEEEIPYDIGNAIVEVGGDDPADAKTRALALSSLRETPAFEKLVIGQKRVANILQGLPEPPPVDESLLKEDAERYLYDQAKGIEKDFLNVIEKAEYPKALEIILSLREPIDRLFDDVLIMTDDEALRQNRLGLLSQVSKLFLRIADFSKIVLEGE